MDNFPLLYLMVIWISLAVSCYLPAVSGQDTCSDLVPLKVRSQEISITDFGGVGDGETLNTEAFRAAISKIDEMNSDSEGGVLLRVPAGVYLTENFNLTSNMTLYLAKNAVIKASQDTENWPLVDPLPSYGRGRERPGGRYISFILGYKLQDVIITGENGTIDGQGEIWWNMWKNNTLDFTRPGLVELMFSTDVIVSNLTLINSPFWNIHPVYCRNVVINHMTIRAPPDSPNTDGVDADSSNFMCIEDCYINNGDDLVAIKSGWDQYGIAFNRSSSDIVVRRITGTSQPFAGIAFGSEMSGGIHNILIENINLYNTYTGIYFKTTAGRGGVVQNITIKDVYMQNVGTAIRFAGNVGQHPDDNFDPNAIPVVKGITIANVLGVNITKPGSFNGLEQSPFRGICLQEIHLWGTLSNATWMCSNVEGSAIDVQPSPCEQLTSDEINSICPDIQ